MNPTHAVFGFLALSGIASLQAQSRTAQFEVASIREMADGMRSIPEFKASGPRAEYYGFGIQMLVAEAWNVQGDQVTLGPGVSPNQVLPMMVAGRSTRIYHIMAQASDGTTPTRDEFRTMLKSLLATRFKLATHTEKRDKDVYVLKTNGTPKLKPNTGDGTCRVTASRTSAGQRMIATHCPVQTLIRNLFADRMVHDLTGLTGFYDFDFTSALPFQSNDPEATTPFTAVKDLGLKLETQRLTLDTLVIDHVEKPSDN